MIFLMKDHTYRIVESDAIDDHKAIKKFLKWQDKIAFVMIDCASRLRSDTWTIVSAEHFKTSFRTFHVKYSFAMFMQDTPMDELSTVERELSVTAPTDFYNVATLLHQLLYAAVCAEWLCQDFWTIELLNVEMWFDGEEDHGKWQSAIISGPSPISDADVFRKEELEDLMEAYGLYIDTDKALDATMVDDGDQGMPSYFTRYNRFDGTQQLTHYFHKRRFALRLANGRWELLLNPSIAIEQYDEFDDQNVIYATCINHTGLVYMANPRITLGIDRLTTGVLNVYHSCATGEVKGLGHELGENYGVVTYDFYSSIDLLYTCLYVPQIWDLLKYFYEEQPESVVFQMSIDKYYECSFTLGLKQTPEEYGISMDIFNVMARAVAEGYRIPTFDELRLD